jgi:hypothetical protein
MLSESAPPDPALSSQIPIGCGIAVIRSRFRRTRADGIGIWWFRGP